MTRRSMGRLMFRAPQVVGGKTLGKMFGFFFTRLGWLLVALFIPTAVAYGNVLVVGISGEHGNFDPCIGGSPWTTEIVSAVYETPVGYRLERIDGHWMQAIDDVNGWQPLLAEKVEVSEDGRTYTFHLRRGVRFYPSGNEMTAKDWLYSWERQLSEPELGWCRFQNKEASISGIDAIEILDDYTVRITTDQPNPRTLPFMRFQMFSILDSETVKQHATEEDPWATEWLSQNTAGTGPYYIASMDPGNELVLQANPYYWGEPPHFSTVIIKIIPETSTRLALLARGDLDIATNIPFRLAESFGRNPGVKVLSVPSGNRVYIGFRVDEAPYDNLALRQAIAYAVPYDDIIQFVYHGFARRYDSFVLPEIPGYSGAGFDYDLDLEKAKERLAASGIDLSQRLTLFYNAAVPEHREIAVLLQDYLGRIGLRVDIQALPAADFTSRIFAKEASFFIQGGISWIDDPSTIVGLWMETGAAGNFTGFSNEEVDRLQREWQFQPPSPERNAVYEHIQAIYNSELNVIYLALTDHVVLMRHDIEGFVLYKDTGIRYRDLYRATN